MRRSRLEIGAVPREASLHRWSGIHDALQESALAGAIAPEQSHALAGRDDKIDAVQDMAVAVERIETADFKHGPAPCPGRSAGPSRWSSPRLDFPRRPSRLGSSPSTRSTGGT